MLDDYLEHYKGNTREKKSGTKNHEHYKSVWKSLHHIADLLLYAHTFSKLIRPLSTHGILTLLQG